MTAKQETSKMTTTIDQSRPLLGGNDVNAVRERLQTWWDGGSIGRPAMHISCPAPEPIDPGIAKMAQPEGWQTDYSTTNYDYRVYLSRTGPLQRRYFAEAIPTVSPDLAPNCLALYLGCRGLEMPGTVWCEPCIKSPETAVFDIRDNNFYWQFTQRLAADQKRYLQNTALIQFPDLIEGLDTLEAMRGGEKLLLDLYDRPEWVHQSLVTITERYFHYYDALYEMIKDETGGSVFWCWAPGRMVKLQCDFSAMLGPDMFGEFMAPVLQKMCPRFDHCMYHWDGPGAIAHHDHLLAIADLDMIQWTPGAGAETPADSKWWPLFHKTIDAGKKVYIYAYSIEQLQALKREFGTKLESFLIGIGVATPTEAEQVLRMVET